jgi:hypothetical protein
MDERPMSVDSTTMQSQGAEQLVERARAGDQNAMAILAMVGANARKGVPKAKSALCAVDLYIKDHPVPLSNWAEGAEVIGILKNPDNPDEGLLDTLLTLPEYEDARLVHTAAVVMSLGRPWTKPRIHNLDAQMSHEERRPFRFGIENAGDARKMGQAMQGIDENLAGFLCAGHVIGMARKIQMIRRPEIPVGILCKDVEWELGCL